VERALGLSTDGDAARRTPSASHSHRKGLALAREGACTRDTCAPHLACARRRAPARAAGAAGRRPGRGLGARRGARRAAHAIESAIAVRRARGPGAACALRRRRPRAAPPPLPKFCPEKSLWSNSLYTKVPSSLGPVQSITRVSQVCRRGPRRRRGVVANTFPVYPTATPQASAHLST